MTSIAIRLDEDEVLHAYSVARLKSELYDLLNKTNGRAAYPNHPQGHFVGRLGEVACYKWLKSEGLTPQPNFMLEKNDVADITLFRTGLRIEVKSWRVSDYSDLGRAVSLKQLSAMMSRCDVLMWCAVGVREYKLYPEVIVQIAGWSYMDDFQNAQGVKVGSSESAQIGRKDVKGMGIFPKRALVAV